MRASTGRSLAVALLALGASGCDELRLGRPEALWLLWLVPLLVVFFVFSARTRALLLRRFAAPAMIERLLLGSSRARRVLKASLLVVAFTAGVLSLAGFKIGFDWEEVERRGVDLVIALDVSDSMLVEDAAPGGRLSRLERARREISDLLGLLEGDRIALVAFAGTAFLELPLTLDYSAAQLYLDALEPSLIPLKGTDLSEALRVSIEAFDREGGGEKAIILITDGEDHSGKVPEMVTKATEQGIRVFAIGIGRDEGSPIPQEGGGFRRDSSGEIVLSHLDEALLQKIALETGGKYVRSITGDLDLDQIYFQGVKATMQERQLGSSRRQRWHDRFQWLLAVSLGALMAEPLIAESARRRPGSAAGGGTDAA